MKLRLALEPSAESPCTYHTEGETCTACIGCACSVAGAEAAVAAGSSWAKAAPGKAKAMLTRASASAPLHDRAGRKPI